MATRAPWYVDWELGNSCGRQSFTSREKAERVVAAFAEKGYRASLGRVGKRPLGSWKAKKRGA